jgi:hypothetical protein
MTTRDAKRLDKTHVRDRTLPGIDRHPVADTVVRRACQRTTWEGMLLSEYQGMQRSAQALLGTRSTILSSLTAQCGNPTQDHRKERAKRVMGGCSALGIANASVI